MFVTYALIGLNLALFLFLNFYDNGILSYFLSLNSAFWQLELKFQPISSMFIHANLTHLIVNMGALFWLGLMLERYLGSLRFALVYILGGALTSLFSLFYITFMYLHGVIINLVGASGAICVLLGVLAHLSDKQTKKGLIVALLLMSFAPLLFGANIAWYAHIIGFLLGYIYAKASSLKNLKTKGAR